MRKIAPLFLVFVLSFSGVAHAASAPIDAAGAAILKKQVEDELQWRVNMTKIFNQGWVTDGKVDVTPKGNVYEVQLPHITVLAGPEGKLDIGQITFNATPGAQPGAWDIKQLALPPAMTFYDAKNVAVARITISTQHFTATWLPEKSIYPKIDSLFENIQVTGTGDPKLNGKIAAVKTLVNLKDNGDGTWSGPADFEGDGILLDVPGLNPVEIGAAKVVSHNLYDRLDLNQSLKMKEVARKAMDEKLPQTDQEKKEFLAKLMTQTPFTADGMSGTLTLDKFFLHDTGAPPAQAQRDVAIEHITLAGITANGAQGKSKLFLKTAFDGLHVSFIPAALADLLPHTLNLEITFDSLPSKDIAAMFFNIVQKSAVASADAQNAAAQQQAQTQAKAEVSNAMALLPRLLEQSGSSVTVQNSYLKSNTLDARLQGHFDASSGAALGATGKLSVTFKGLDEAAQKMQSEALKPGADPHMLGYLMGLMTLQAKGQADKAADGKSIRNYIFELKPDGNLLLNGVSVKPMGQNMAPVPVMPHSHPMIPAPLPGNPAPTQP